MGWGLAPPRHPDAGRVDQHPQLERKERGVTAEPSPLQDGDQERGHTKVGGAERPRQELTSTTGAPRIWKATEGLQQPSHHYIPSRGGAESSSHGFEV